MHEGRRYKIAFALQTSEPLRGLDENVEMAVPSPVSGEVKAESSNILWLRANYTLTLEGSKVRLTSADDGLTDIDKF